MSKNHKTLTALAFGIGAAWTWRAILRNKRAYDLNGKTVLITGGSRGLGLILARQLADAGAKLSICARSESELAKAKTDLEARGAQVLTTVCDVADKAQIENVVEKTVTHFGGIDVLFCVAGVFIAGPIESMTDDDFEYSMKVNFWGAYHATMAALPYLKKNATGGRVVHMSSVGGRIATPHLIPYNASKFALSGFSQGMRVELEKDGVLVTTVFPWIMRVGSLRNAQFKGRHRAEYAVGSIMNANPLLSDDPERAAAAMIAAMKRGDSQATLWLTKATVLLDTILPELSKDAMCIANRLMPNIDGEDSVGTQSRRGYESESSLAPSWLTAPLEKAAEKYGEIL